MLVTAIVSLASAPIGFGVSDLAGAALKGTWLGVLVGAVLVGGLFFREAVYESSGRGTVGGHGGVRNRRRSAFGACFLTGTFTECATGFGVGQLAISPTLARLSLKRADALVLGFFSQSLVPWGAFANGTMVGAQFSAVDANTLGLFSAALTLPLLLGWLCLFWRITAKAGISGTPYDAAREILYAIAISASLAFFSWFFGPEVAGMAAIAPLIALEFLLTENISGGRLRAALPIIWPFIALIAALSLFRSVPSLRHAAISFAVAPFPGGATYFPLLHPATWLFAIGSGLWLSRRDGIVLGDRILAALSAGRRSVVAIVLFLGMAQILGSSGIAGGLAGGLKEIFGRDALISVPMMGGLFGYMTSASSVANGLLMSAQVALAPHGPTVLWAATIQNVAAAALTMVSPVRVSLVSGPAGQDEKAILIRTLPLALVPLVILTVVAGFVIAVGE